MFMSAFPAHTVASMKPGGICLGRVSSGVRGGKAGRKMSLARLLPLWAQTKQPRSRALSSACCYTGVRNLAVFKTGHAL